MKLIKCNIENFGTLHQYSHEFTDGVNTICELNGWGKSTFAAFIKAMFYGMEATRSRKNLDDEERKKYKPWQGGAFGGSLDFELNGRQYRIERFFGTKAKDDVFKLWDLRTGLASGDYSENIGEEIFLLDKAAYSRSTYIPQNSISLEANDSINAKLSNLAEKADENDINNFESAVRLLDKAKKEFHKSGQRGRLSQMSAQRTLLEEDLKRCERKAESLGRWNGHLHELLLHQKETKKTMQALRTQIEETGRYEVLEAARKSYEGYAETDRRHRAALAPLQKFFNGPVPSEEQIISWEDLVSDMLKLKGEFESSVLTKDDLMTKNALDLFFARGVPTEEEIIVCDELFGQYRDNQIRLKACELTEYEKVRKAELEEFFGGTVPPESEVDHFIRELPRMNDLERDFFSEKNRLDLTRNLHTSQNIDIEKNKKRGKRFLLPVFGIVFMLAGIVWMLSQMLPGAVCLFAGLVLLAAGIISERKHKLIKAAERKNIIDAQAQELQEISREIERISGEKEAIESDLKHFLSVVNFHEKAESYYSALSLIKTNLRELKELREKQESLTCTALRKTQSGLREEIDRALAPYSRQEMPLMMEKEAFWKQVKANQKQYREIFYKTKRYEEAEKKYLRMNESLGLILKEYFEDPRENQQEKIKTLMERRNEYLWRTGELERNRLQMEQFEAENDIDALKDLSPPPYCVSQLKEKERELEQKWERQIEEENDAREQIRILSVDADRCPELQSGIEQLSEEITEGERRLDVINETMLCLEEAKELFATRYMEKLKRGFEKYIRNLDNGTLGEMAIDVHFNINVSSGGGQKSVDYYSAGYKDLIGIAARMALIEALFETERPFIILDDPFTNLDGQKLQNALKLMEEIAEKYQVIYFVCHESRMTIL